MTALIVPGRFTGPPSSGNGGWTAGALAALVTGPGTPAPAVEVSLRMPPPLDVPYDVTHDGGATTASYRGRTVATARPADTAPDPVPPVGEDAARDAEGRFAGLGFHPFPTCFSCGVGRADGLRIFPGLVHQQPARVAATWTPAPDTAATPGDRCASVAVTWSALDCVGGWAGDLEERLMVLGRMTAAIERRPVVGEPHVVVGEARGGEGRKTYTASTLYDADGGVVGRAEHVWIAVDPRDFA